MTTKYSNLNNHNLAEALLLDAYYDLEFKNYENMIIRFL